MKKFSLFAAAFALVSLSLVSCGNASEKAANDSEATEAVNEVKKEAAATVEAVNEAEGMVSVEDDNMFRPDTKVDVLTILDFNATWCVPCKKLTPSLDKAAEEFKGKANFYTVDIDKNRETAKAFNVTSVPTVVFISPDGKVDTYIGLDPFVKGITNSTSAEEFNAVIFKNLSEMITKSL